MRQTQTVFHDKRGMTLIEVVIALGLLTVVALALVQSSLVAMNANVVNEIRDEAVGVADEELDLVRNTPYASLSSLPTSSIITRRIRAFTIPYTVSLAMTAVNANSQQVLSKVTWTYRNKGYEHSVSTVVRMP